MNQKNLEKRKNRAIWIGNQVLRIIMFVTYFSVFRLLIYTYDMQETTPFIILALLSFSCYFVYDILARVYEGFLIGKCTSLDILIAQVLSVTIADVFVMAMGSAYKRELLEPPYILQVLLFQVLVIILWVLTTRHIYRSLNSPNGILVISGELNDPEVVNKLAFFYDRFKILKKLLEDDIPDSIKAIDDLWTPELNDKIDGVLINHVKDPKREIILQYCQRKGIKVYLVPELSDVTIKSAKMIHLIDTPIFLCESFNEHDPKLMLKRLSDIVLSSLALVVLSPLMLIVAICIKLEDHGPVFFLQDRCTQGNKVFKIYKFRSMYVDCDSIKVLPTMENDPRVTKTGRFIRACRIDELPQLINIIKGDMSIVGPRPERVEHVEAYTQMLPEFEMRNKMKGGLTGYAQVYGKYNTTPYDKLCMDLVYINNWSLGFDICIILQTIKVCLKKESTEAFTQQNASMIMETTDKIRKGKLNNV